MKKVKVVFLGSRPLGHFALKFLENMESVEVVGVLVKEPASSAWWKDDPFYLALSNKLKII